MGWYLEHNEVPSDRERILQLGVTYAVANGYMGYRGTLEEYTADQFVACNLNGVYDRVGEKWRESVNAPNPFYVTVSVDDEPYSVVDREPAFHCQKLDFRYGLHRRKTSWKAGGQAVTVHVERFASMDDVHLLAMSYTVKVGAGGRISVRTGIDGRVWDLNGPHLHIYDRGVKGDAIYLASLTQELHVPVVVAEICKRDFSAEERIVTTEEGIYRDFVFEAEPQTEYTFWKFAVVYHGRDGEEDAFRLALDAVGRAAHTGYDALLKAHKRVWDRLWKTSDVKIEGDPEAQKALRYSIYQLLSCAPRHTDRLSIPARGLSSQTYKGAVFWDTEMFMFPFFLATQPEIARNLLGYRIHTLEGARRKAREYGYAGAFYAWESQETGDDACSHFNVVDVFTGRPLRTYFRDKQIHVNAAIVKAFRDYVERTGDEGVLIEGGAEVILECARFYLSYLYYRPHLERYEILDVTGPDEYHERVHNNAYTNRMVKYTLETARWVEDRLGEAYPDAWAELKERLGWEREARLMEDVTARLYVPDPDPETGVMEQFSGYFKLEDCPLEEVRSRLLDPREYWGGDLGVATHTQIIKQADVVLLLALFPHEYSREVMRANWEYYEPRTEHGSSLSHYVYGLVACHLDMPERAYPFFMKSATIDITGSSKQFAGLIYIGGAHLGACGGSWILAVRGFGGYQGDGVLTPRLPQEWKALEFTVYEGGTPRTYRVTPEGTTCRA
ncbi:glycoside hydrolase family 65 protein [Spirochaeta thermophila]|uniref:Kojibiose phosphorylase n=1 Tax=Winmispira thermophila (strain ATCC 49972 / DSM 6192 / RI 19.B1) TaxID=665571 RepID=E0RTU7_WINT6|nr:glycoside hydrolase family 65 protein [Spirochaeta thermophila]ADN02472.1 kojibiose phosphorylase [Spirochaeta thermophila DSM 6192]